MKIRVRQRQILLPVLLLAIAACTPRNRSGSGTPPNAPATAQSGVLSPGDYTQSLVFGGRERSYILHLPPSIISQPRYALVIVLHGGGGAAAGAAKMTGMSAKADKEGFIVVYPDGTGRLDDRLLTWNSGNCCGYALDNNVDDVGFVRTLIDRFLGAYPIDAKRVYVTGISNGGMMSYRVACELSDRIAAIAPVAGALNNECKPAQPVSVIAFHGTADENVPYAGGVASKRADPHPREDKSVAYAMNFWSGRDGCSRAPQRSEEGNIVREEYAGCASGTSVVLYTIKGGGHAWAGGERLSLLLDAPTKEISATDVMWEFFAQHAKP